MLKGLLAIDQSIEKVLEALFTSILEHLDLLQGFLFAKDLREGLKALLLKSIPRSRELFKLHMRVLVHGFSNHLAALGAEAAVSYI